MKKIFLIFIILLTTGCYDYVELNNLSIISSIGIDYRNDEYTLSLEVLNDKSDNENPSLNAYDVSVNGKTITEAFENASITLNKIPYYYHLKAIIIDEEIAYNHLLEITDYFVRNPKMIHGFYLVMCKNISAKDFLNIKNDNHLVIGNEIVSKMENNSYEYSISYNELFEDVLERLINKKKDAMLTTFTINNGNIKTYGIALFKDSKLVKVLDEKSSSYLNILLSNPINLTLENDDLVINIYNNKTDISFDNNVNINVSSEAQIIVNKKDNNLKKDESYLKFNDEFSKILLDKLTNLLNELSDLEVDPLGIKWQYYQIYKKDQPKLNTKIMVDLKVNKKGLIFEANYE